MTAALLTLVALTGLGVLAAIGLRLALRQRAGREPVVDAIDARLPQTQCGQCGYPGCRPYAQAIAAGRAEINQCPPGGDATIRALADLLGRRPLPLDETHGVHKPRQVALIDEDICIGCKKCIIACPVDAIVGAPKLMHTVVTVECTGCELCVPVCPVDCIDLVAPLSGIDAWTPPAPQREPAAA